MQQRNDEQQPKPHYAVLCSESKPSLMRFSADLKEIEQEAVDKARQHPGENVYIVQLVGAFATQAPRVERVPLDEVLA